MTLNFQFHVVGHRVLLEGVPPEAVVLAIYKLNDFPA